MSLENLQKRSYSLGQGEREVADRSIRLQNRLILSLSFFIWEDHSQNKAHMRRRGKPCNGKQLHIGGYFLMEHSPNRIPAASRVPDKLDTIPNLCPTGQQAGHEPDVVNAPPTR